MAYLMMCPLRKELDLMEREKNTASTDKGNTQTY